ncbi:MAG TPA: 3-dehydroquinate synthase [Thermohalobaculum sp.]|nr:3-dehydroquinate synthase [Thermohalobaculum sp.]
MNASVRVDLGARGYEIRIGAGLLDQAGALIAPLLPRPRTVIVTDGRVATHHLGRLRRGLAAAGIEAAEIVVPPGEGTKSMGWLGHVLDRLLALGVERDDLILAFGGGVVGDLAGFAAAVLRRGVGFVQVPTTLLAQVDSSVGGKTGINAAAGKNLIGAFHQPRLVLADTDVLRTLPRRELLAGYAEVAKYGLIRDAAFFGWLEEHGPGLRDGDEAARVHAIRRSCEIKAAIVAEDETEQGSRALLNLGHTFGHALEAVTGYSGRLLHGEAVAIGTGLALDLSVRSGHCDARLPERAAAHFAAMGMPRTLADIPGPLPGPDALMAAMAQDKKVRQGRAAFILVRAVGDAFVSRDVDPAVVRSVLEDALAKRAA